MERNAGTACRWIAVLVGLCLWGAGCRRPSEPAAGPGPVTVRCFQGHGRPDELRRVPAETDFRCERGGQFVCPVADCVLLDKPPPAKWYRHGINVHTADRRPPYLDGHLIYRWEVALSDEEMEKARQRHLDESDE